MTVNKILQILKMGNKKGSALKELAEYYGCEDYDLSAVSDNMADAWLSRQKCELWTEGNWVKGYDTCLGTREKDPCSCKGDKTKCDYYKRGAQ